jgi:hypothetical protein
MDEDLKNQGQRRTAGRGEEWMFNAADCLVAKWKQTNSGMLMLRSQL